MFLAIMHGVIVMLLTVLMDRSLRGEDFLKKVGDGDDAEFTRFNWNGFDDSVAWTRAIGYGVAVAILATALVYAGGRWWLVAAVCLVGMVLLMLQYAWWWGFAGCGGVKALIWFILIQWVLQSVAADAMQYLVKADLIAGNKILTFVVVALPNVVATLCTSSAIIGLCRRREKVGLAGVFTCLMILGIVLSIAGGVAMAGIDKIIKMNGMSTVSAQVMMEEEEEVPETGLAPELISYPAVTPTPALVYGGQNGAYNNNQNGYYGNQYGQYGSVNNQQTVWYTFYNFLIQNDVLWNDNNFGPDPRKTDWKAIDYVNDLCARIEKDPVLGAADIAYFDRVAGTEISGVKYNGYEDGWLDAINARAAEFVKDQSLYRKVISEFYRTLNSNIVERVEIRSYKENYLMFMDPGKGPYDVNASNNRVYYGNGTINMPKVIVMKDGEQADYLVFMVKRVNSSYTLEAKYKLACGYQPPMEGAGSSSGGSKGGTNPGGNNNPGPGPGPGPGSSSKKDPTKGTDVGKNDTTGPGPNTNNGVGSRTSSADMPTNSTSMTYNEYKEEVHEITVVNEGQKVGGDPNTPTASTPAGAEVVSNADSGTGYGGIDAGTAVESYVQTDGGVAVGGQTETHIEMPD